MLSKLEHPSQKKEERPRLPQPPSLVQHQTNSSQGPSQGPAGEPQPPRVRRKLPPTPTDQNHLTQDDLDHIFEHHRSIEKVEVWRRQCGFPPSNINGTGTSSGTG
ncbi:unnamed protein product [Caenorhabditis sp. 36 PRJEB53466]|nr:unnamed protein product [Caenorhabditis sp. 36 PRJEB53466]